VLDSADVSEQRASYSVPDSVPIESEEERAAREQGEIVALDAVGDYEASRRICDAGGCTWRHCLSESELESEGVVCTCCCVGVCVCVCMCARAPSMCVRENLYLHFLNFVCVCVC
jgi:hypothetical protein